MNTSTSLVTILEEKNRTPFYHNQFITQVLGEQSYLQSVKDTHHQLASIYPNEVEDI